MEFSRIRVLESFFSLMTKAIRNVINYNMNHSDFPLKPELIQKYLVYRLILSLVWGFSGDSKSEHRKELSDFARNLAGSISFMVVDLSAIPPECSILEYDVSLPLCDWVPWKTKVPSMDVDTQKVAEADLVIPTIDTIRHEELIYSFLAEHKPVVLVGPPGSGKTMSLFGALRKIPEMEVVGVNFSSATGFEFLLSTFDQHCECRKTPDGFILSPKSIGKWLVIFCDEINLPDPDAYGSQKVISFIRELVEHQGFWRNKQWIKLERIQFVGACNPPTDPGRKPLSLRK
jgi:dynein heavy chain 1